MPDASTQAPPAPDSGVACVVTGAAGFIGSHLVDRLLADGHSVVGVDCFTDYYPRPVKEQNLAAALEHPRFTLHDTDLRTADIEPLIADADTVFHLAAMAGLLRSWTWFDEYMTCNVLATQRLLDAVREAGTAHLIHVSTSSVYGRDSSGGEDRPKLPSSPYGVTKLAGENLVMAYATNFGLPATVLRYFSIYGPRQRPDMGYKIFIDNVLSGAPITIFGDGSQTRGNTYIDDCISATMAAFHHGPTGEAFNIGGGEIISAIDAVRMIERLVGREVHIEYAPPRPGEQARALADTAKAKSVLDWEPSFGIEAGLKAQLTWQAERADQAADQVADQVADQAADLGVEQQLREDTEAAEGAGDE